MDETQLLDLLSQNISFQLRHAFYDRTVEVGADCHMMTTGKGQEREVLRYRRFEAQDLKKQRLRLYNPITPVFISEADILDRLTRVDGVRKDLQVSSDKDKQALMDAAWNFQPGTDLETWLVGKIRFLLKNDPNAWILFDRNDRRNASGEIEKTTLRPVVFRSIDVLNYANDAEGVPLWVLFRDFRMEYRIEAGARKDVQLETYYLYDRERVIKAREVGEQTTMNEGEILLEVDIYPIVQNAPTENDGNYSYQKPAVIVGEKKRRSFYISSIEHGAGEVPAFPVGAYPDELTDQQTSVSWFWPGMPVLQDVIRDKQMQDVATVMQAFRRRSEFSPACEYETEQHERCEKGWIYAGEHGKTRCPSCGGSGLRANFTTEQEVLRLVMPEGIEPAQMLELSKLAFEEPTDTTVLEWFDKQLDKHRVRFNNSFLGDGMYERPTGTATKTATEITERTDAKADILRSAGAVVSKGWELYFRVLASCREIGEVKANHSYPEKIDLLTLNQEIANMAAIQQVDIYEAKVHQRHRILQKQFEGEPETHQRIQAWYNWLPFDDKSPEQLAQILALLSPLDSNYILWAYWKEIRREIEVATPNFHLLTYEAQKALIDAKVAEYREKIQLAGQSDFVEPNFNDDIEDEPQEGNQ
jgi:hypothetical protein